MFGNRLATLVGKHRKSASFREMAEQMDNAVSHTTIAKWAKGDVSEISDRAYEGLAVLTGQSGDSIRYWLENGKQLDPQTEERIQQLRNEIDKLLLLAA